ALGDRLAAADVAVAGSGVGRNYAKGDEGVREFVGELGGGVDGPAELLVGLDGVIGGHDDHGRVRISPADQGGTESDARGRVAAPRLAAHGCRGGTPGLAQRLLPRR